jgi:hypothetical protein
MITTIKEKEVEVSILKWLEQKKILRLMSRAGYNII